jgi:hypothetical protein
MLSDKIRDKENNSYDKSPKHYHNNLKVNAGINPRAKDLPRVTALTNLNKNTLQTNPQEVILIVTTDFEREQKGATPEHLPDAPWTQPHNPDNFTMTPAHPHTKPYPAEILNKHITRSHYDKAINQAPPSKAPGPDAITNELIKHHPEEAHTLIYTIL